METASAVSWVPLRLELVREKRLAAATELGYCRVGEATTFCWRLERSSSFVAGQGDTDILHYSIKLEVRHHLPVPLRFCAIAS